jgi:uncharacterized protein
MTNRLARETSPYLLQHSANPVDWYPWGSEAFERSRREEKPIFLSIGYSTCHWCHVMERESFENAEIAAYLNEHFVPIKVDREERPDVDRVYMSAVQMMTGGGGWPMSMFLTPELAPFYGGTYYPPEDMYGRPGFKSVLERISQFWTEEKEKALESGRQLIEILNEQRDDDAHAAANPDASLLDTAYATTAASYDRNNAGFGTGAKFPRPVVFTFLFRTYKRTRNDEALRMALTTLMAMASGGMYDHLGGGFHRYAVDAAWRVPHFEKMLYDQAQLVRSYTDAYELTRDEFFARIARETIAYVLRDLRDARGGFYSAEDADSRADPSSHELKEGAFYVWKKDEIDRVLTPEESHVFCAYYSISDDGNVKTDPHGEFREQNILYAPVTLALVAEQCGIGEHDADLRLESAKKKLFDVRASRMRPFLDDKIIAAWNGQMIAALARASVVFGEPRFRAAAVEAAEFLVTEVFNKETKMLSRLYRHGREGQKGGASAEAHLDDYACVTEGLLELHEATQDDRWLKLAQTLTGTQEALFWDAAEGGFFETSGKDPSVLVRMKEMYDGAEPAGNSVAAMNLVRLARMTSTPSYQMQAGKTIRSLCAKILDTPHMMPLMMSALGAWLSPQEFVCTPEAGCALPEKQFF